MNIYTITLIDSRNYIENGAEGSQRCIGWYKSIRKAKDAVQQNKGEMHECRYNYLVIEEMREGVWNGVKEEWWYHWIDRRWIVCSKPLIYIGIIGFAMG